MKYVAVAVAVTCAGCCPAAHTQVRAAAVEGQPGDAETGDAKASDAKASDAKASDANTGDAETGAVRVADTGPQVQIVNEPGQMVALDDVLVRGKVTVVDFYADWCGACKVMEAKLLEQIADEPRIAVRKINIEDDESEVAKHYDIGALPHFRIYKPDGELAYVLVGNECLRSAELALEELAAASD